MAQEMKVHKGNKAWEMAKELRLKQYNHKKDKAPTEAERHLKRYKEMEKVL